MRLRERIAAMFGLHQTPHDETRVVLDNAEGRMAGRLSRLTGKRRDEVFAESYRRADTILVDRAAARLADAARRRRQ